MRLALLFLLLVSYGLSAQPADTLYREVYHRPGTFKAFALDPLQQVYLVTAGDELLKLDAAGRELFRYDDSTLGRLGTVDASNPFNLLLYYPDHQTVVLLDRTLSEQGRLDLRQARDIQNAAAVARSFDDHLWVYDDWAYRLKKLDHRGEVQLTTDDLRLLLNVSEAPRAIFASGNEVYLYFPERGVAVLTNFGRFREWIDLPPAAGRWQWTAGGLVFLTAEGWQLWRAGQNPAGGLPLPLEAKDWLQTGLVGNRLVFLDAAGLHVLERN